MESVECIVVGAGVVGLAIARALTLQGREVLIIESESTIGSITSSRNSGVIHAGLYYRPGSLKARACVKGREMLYGYAAERDIPHKRCGKLVVATEPGQTAELHKLKENAELNGVTGINLITEAEAKQMEPELACTEALHVPVSGIIDVHELMHALLGDAENGGATLALNAPVIRGDVTKAKDFQLEIGGAAPMQIGCRLLINTAGLGAQNLSKNLYGLDKKTIPPLVLAKGNYFTLSGKSPFQMLVYPLPVPGSLGLHFSCDMGGQPRFGPDVEWVDHIDYRVDPLRVTQFEEAVHRYWPKLVPGSLSPGYAGIRPKLGANSPHNSEFVIQTHKDHNIPGLINLYGIESPGLTSCLALAQHVVEHLS